MIIKNNIQEDFEKITELEALELYIQGDVVYVPYMMNDAVECYYKFSGCNVVGNWNSEFSGETFAHHVENKGRKGIVIRQGQASTVTIWYDEVHKYMELYQYHRIAHFWIKGNEKWRRLVYIVGTIHDKLVFLGPEYCTQEEIELASLMEFAPFRYWTPIDDNLDKFYLDTNEGIVAIKKILVSLNHSKLGKAVNKYAVSFIKGDMTGRKVKCLAKQLSKDKELYHFINSLIEKASLNYQTRSYTKEMEAELMELRKKAISKYESLGYTGEYPVLLKKNRKVTFYEEHPYVMQDFEYDNFGFSINTIEESIR